MKASQLIARLQRQIERRGDLEVQGFYDGGEGAGSVEVFPLPALKDGTPACIAIEIVDGHGGRMRRTWPKEELAEDGDEP